MFIGVAHPLHALQRGCEPEPGRGARDIFVRRKATEANRGPAVDFEAQRMRAQDQRRPLDYRGCNFWMQGLPSIFGPPTCCRPAILIAI